MFLADHEMFDICEKLNINIDTLRFYIFGENGSGSNEYCWYQVKKRMDPLVIGTYMKDKKIVLDKTAGTALKILNENLLRIQAQFSEDSSYTLSIDDLKKLAGIVVDMDKMCRLESGSATEIVDSIAHMSIADAKRLLSEDPFRPTIEGEFEDISIPDDNEIETSRELKGVSRPWKE